MTLTSQTTEPTRPSLPQSRDEWTAALSRPGVVLLPLRLFLGITFSFAGLQKLADPHFFEASRPTSIQGQIALFKATSPIRFMLGPVSSHAVLFGVLTAIAEIGVGVGTLLGLWSRAAAALGALLSLSFFLTVSWRTRPYYYGSDIVFVFMWLPFIMAGSAGVLSLDGWRRASTRAPEQRGHQQPRALPQEPMVNRRTVVATGAVAAGGLALAGLDAAIGRGFAHDLSEAAAARDSITTVPSGSSAITSAAAVDSAGGVEFRNPTTGDPAYVVQTAPGKYTAFSAICTHQGCTVAFVRKTSQFQCPCHGGLYDAKTGKVLGGPPPAPLQQIAVKDVDGQIHLV
jgi:thiosulfate dehydrogenase [quinone] large subunit